MTERLLTTADVADLLAVSAEWVREHATEFGAIRVGDGPRGELRFEPARVTEALERRRLGAGGGRTKRRPGRKSRSQSGVELIELPAWAA